VIELGQRLRKLLRIIVGLTLGFGKLLRVLRDEGLVGLICITGDDGKIGLGLRKLSRLLREPGQLVLQRLRRIDEIGA